jgi:hypothetical protein
MTTDVFTESPVTDPEWWESLGANPPEHERTEHLAGRQDDHPEKDLEESQRGSGQDVPDYHLSTQEFLGRHPQ